MPLSSVLGAQSLIKPGVCASSTRPASPYDGQVIYETDTNRTLVFNGSTWDVLGPGVFTSSTRPSSPFEGQTIYETDTKETLVYSGAAWVTTSDIDQSPFASWTSYTPVLTAATTNPTLGSGSVVSGRYTRIGKLVAYRFYIAFGTSGVNAGSGSYRISLPVSSTTTGGAGVLTMGSLFVYDSSTTNAYTGLMGNTSNATYLSDIYYAQGGALAALSNSTPWTWAASDQIRGFIIYEAA